MSTVSAAAFAEPLRRIPKFVLFGAAALIQLALLAVMVADRVEILRPRGVAVLMEAEHSCMSMRGVQKAGALTITSQFLGSFRDDPGEQARFISLTRAGEGLSHGHSDSSCHAVGRA